MAKPNGLVRASSDSFPSQLGRSSDTATGPFIGIMDEVIKRYLAGEKINDISTACGVSCKWITSKISVLRRAGYYISHRRNPRTDANNVNRRAKFIVTLDAKLEAIDKADEINEEVDDFDQRKWKKSAGDQSREFIEALRKFYPTREVQPVEQFSRY